MSEGAVVDVRAARDSTTVRVVVGDMSGVSEARRAVADLARRLGLGVADVERASIAVTEAASNLVRHASGGEILVRALPDPGGPGVEILSLDRGPGIANLGASLRDGHSTAGGQGTGLGAIRRLSAVFDVYSLPARGTALVGQLRSTAPVRPGAHGSAPEFGVVCVPVAGETACGDGWVNVALPRGQRRLAVVDGLGHGPEAAIAAREAEQALAGTDDASPAALLERVDRALVSTRGAAVAVAHADPARRVVRYAGVGNIRSVVVDGDSMRTLVSHDGIVGHNMRKVQEYSYPLPERALVIMTSDGLTTSWSLSAYPGLASRHPTLVAGCLYRDAARNRDDTTCLVARFPERRSAEKGETA